MSRSSRSQIVQMNYLTVTEILEYGPRRTCWAAAISTDGRARDDGRGNGRGTELAQNQIPQGMAIKVSPLWQVFSGSPEDSRAQGRQFAALAQYHCLPNGIFRWNFASRPANFRPGTRRTA